MQYKYIKANSILNNVTKKDGLFPGDYTIDPYKNCEYGCSYCDSSFDKTIFIKSNAAELLDTELSKSKRGIVIVGSVHDPYQKIEKELCLTRELLKIIEKHNFGCHILTKSNLVKRDIKILSKINKCQVTISLTSLNKKITNIFEKNIPDSFERLKTVNELNENGIQSGVALVPILPHIVEEELEEIIKEAKKHNAQYLVYKHLELKGDQKDHYLDLLKGFYPELVEKYKRLYENSFKPNEKYIQKLKNEIEGHCKKYKLEKRV